MFERTYSPEQVCERTGMGYRAVVALIKAGEIRATDARGPKATRPRYRVKVSDFEAWERDRAVRPAVTLPARPRTVRVPGGGVIAQTIARQRARQAAAHARG